ncbi:TPA: HXXEE domain-containing protein [Klebsiella pneumoniae]|nr:MULTISPECIES: HXXEE domain-containing protein [Enterobacterales]EKN4012784.1 HXXEE domain-containing protein [Yersinia enterocolitica]ELI7911978.1 HXXEE domain-containing protein [Yersinia enterocolitica]ELI8051425.1 HXXEE domain-containing protein [Yersinia enterocolitica]MBG1817597.1 HXXEE domain-containing protein [Klebsiella pneumoniae]MCE7418893.1 HXXEE domain-containing protein [Klebsiella pneumoniae]
MKQFLMKHNLALFSLVATCVLIYTLANWQVMPFTQRMLGLFVFGITLHLWEEGRFPGGFTEMIAEKLNFKADDIHFGQIITSCYVVFIVFVPLFFPHVLFLAIAPMLLGLLEPVAHLLAIRMSSTRYYSPGLVTAVVVLMPISLYTLHHIATHMETHFSTWLMAFLYMLVGLLIAQRLVISASGMKYSEFLKNVRRRLFAK